MVARDHGREEIWSDCLVGAVSFQDDGNVLEQDEDGGFTASNVLNVTGFDVYLYHLIYVIGILTFFLNKSYSRKENSRR